MLGPLVKEQKQGQGQEQEQEQEQELVSRTRTRTSLKNKNKAQEQQEEPHVVGRNRGGRIIPRQRHGQVLARIAHVHRVVLPLFRFERIMVVEYSLFRAGRRDAVGQLHRPEPLGKVQYRHPLDLSVCSHQDPDEGEW